MIDDIKKRALHRTSILEGQLRGLSKMIESEDYCMDIITQSREHRGAIGSDAGTGDGAGILTQMPDA
ncbi:MAG TPA: metal-sensing transcriptional repressor, partial [Microbacterium sp.]|nr:metal-sensing transcriptional repressor [Microbacterium sp.]